MYKALQLLIRHTRRHGRSYATFPHKGRLSVPNSASHMLAEWVRLCEYNMKADRQLMVAPATGISLANKVSARDSEAEIRIPLAVSCHTSTYRCG